MPVRNASTPNWIPLTIAALFIGCGPSSQLLTVGSLSLFGRDERLAIDVAERLTASLYDRTAKHTHSDADGHIERLYDLAVGLVETEVDLIFAYSTLAAEAAKRAVAGTDVPVIFALVDDPVQAGLVTSLDNPDGQVTGVMTLALPLAGKAVDTLIRLDPGVERVLLLRTPNPAYDRIVEAYRIAARQAGLDMPLVEVDTPGEAAQVYLDVAPGRFDAIIESPESEIRHAGLSLGALSAREGIPSISASGRGDGVTMAYEMERDSLADQLAFLGEKMLDAPAQTALPVEIPRRFTLRLFRGRAAHIGYTFSETALMLADEIVDLEKDDVPESPSRW
ncbi:MAG: ABC transporter substrate binding protein [Vicinamibacterales bacterium]|jgi:putative ABC transport system substrate-binding protein|nr:ABC transporter substrate binding protein [Vicinamibacterales bacterium]